ARWLLLVALTPLLWPGSLVAAPKVVASIGPVHSLAAAVMGELGVPTQIVRGYGSPHAYQMRPSDAANLRDADLILWIGPSLETFLQRPLEGQDRRAKVMQLSALPGLRLLVNRRGGVLVVDEQSHAHDEQHGFDTHIWLKPFNAKLIVTAIAEELSALDPENAALYRLNAQRARSRIDVMETRIASRLAPVRATPFVVFHDAFQYFENNFGLNSVGSVTVSPDRVPSAQRIKALRAAIKESGVRCVFREPRFESALMRVLLEDSNTRSSVLDPLGSDVAPGPDAYFELMDSNTDSLIACLEP
ncbi:MAG: zinc ABC transporter substrate-binding protein, partial [Lysobacterales bacterium]